MSFKTTFRGFLIAASFTSTNLVGMVVSASDAENAQIDTVKRFSASKTGEKVSLLLGAVNTREGVDGNWVFLDDEGDRTRHNPDGRPYIKGDFNDITLLEKLAANLELCFDEILVDDSTFRFARWSSPHLSCFLRMLKVDGTFVFCPWPDCIGFLSLYQYQDQFGRINASIVRLETSPATNDDKLVSGTFRSSKSPLDQYYNEGNIPYNKALLIQVFPNVVLRKNPGFPIVSGWTNPHTEIDLFVCKKASAVAL